MEKVYSEQRESGVPLIGKIPWGSSFCYFYQTKEDMLDVLLPYIKAGLDNNEYCIWVTSSRSESHLVCQALENNLPGFRQYLNKRQLKVISGRQWNASASSPEGTIISRLDFAVSKGFDGLRLAVSPSFMKSAKVIPFITGIQEIARYNVIAAFSYPREWFDAAALMEVVKNHRFALVRNIGKLEVIESSEARVAKDALNRSEEKLRFLFSYMVEAFAYHRIVLDNSGKPCDYVFLEINDAFEKLVGLKAEDILGKRVTQVLPGIENDPADWIGRYGKVALTGEPERFESYAEPLKQWYSVSAFSPYKGFFGVTFSNITERKRMEEELQASEQRWATTLASIGDAVIATDTAGKITFMNAVAEELTGWPFSEALDRPITQVFNIVNEQTRQAVDNPVFKVLREGGIAGLANHTILVRKDGTEVSIDDSGAPIKDPSGLTTGVVLVFRDIVERKKAEAEILAANTELNATMPTYPSPLC